MFETHKLNETGFEKVKEFKSKFSQACEVALNALPESREKAIFKTKIEEGVFFATKAIASHPENHTEIIKY